MKSTIFNTIYHIKPQSKQSFFRPTLRMQFTTVLAALTLLAGFTSALPQASSLEPSCYETCLSGRMCIMSYPEGCYCLNGHKVACAEECKIAKPELDSCDLVNPIEPVEPVKPVKPITCFNSCVSQWACIQSWPESCYCHNGIVKKCAEQCSYKGAKYQTCPSKEELAVKRV